MERCPCCGKKQDKCPCQFSNILEGGVWCKSHASYWPNGLKAGSSKTDPEPKTEG